MSTAASRLTFLTGSRCHGGAPRCVGRLAAACEDVATALELEVAETADAPVSRTLVAGGQGRVFSRPQRDSCGQATPGARL